MAKQNTSTDAKFAQLALDRIPPEMKQYASEVHTKPSGSALTPMVQITPQSEASLISGKAIYASFWENLPVTDPQVTISAWYDLFADMVANFDREHDMSFFEVYPELLLVTTTERLQVNTSWLRLNYKKLCTRTVTRLYYYTLVHMNYIGSFVNLCNGGRYSGDGVYARLARDLRWQRIRPISIKIKSYPELKGRTKRIVDKACFAYGKGATGADIFAMPVIITDPFGNRGSHALSIESMIARSVDYREPANPNPITWISEKGTEYNV